MGLLIDLVNEVQVVRGITPATLSTSTQGASADFSNCEIATQAIVMANVTNTLQVTALTVQIEESTDGTTWTAIPGMVCTVTSGTAEANGLQKLRGLRTQRYVRGNAITLAAVTTVGAFSAANVIILAQKKYMPATASGADLYPST